MMKNLSNINYDSIEVYSNSKKSESDTRFNKLVPDTKNLTKYGKLIDDPNNPTGIVSTYTIKNSNFDNLYLLYVTSK